MATTYQITVTNNSPYPQTLYFFQEPANYNGGPTIYTNSLASQQIAAYQSGTISQVQFSIVDQYYAGVQSQTKPPQVGVANVTAITATEIDIASTNPPPADDSTTMSLLGGAIELSTPVNDPSVEEGAFRIVTASFQPGQQAYNAGLAAMANNSLVLSNFVVAEPNQNIDVQPVVIFYVATGSYTAGTTVNFDEVSLDAAVCNATNGQEDFQVTYESNGTWTVQ